MFGLCLHVDLPFLWEKVSKSRAPPGYFAGMAGPKRRASDERLVERLRKLCLSFPDAVEKTSHGEPTWFAGKGKVFAMLDNHHHGAAHLAVWLPQPAGVQPAL